MVNRQFQIACLTASVLGLTALGVFADSGEVEALENKSAPLEEVIVLGRFLQSDPANGSRNRVRQLVLCAGAILTPRSITSRGC